MSFGFPNPIPVCSSSASVHLPGSPSLLSLWIGSTIQIFRALDSFTQTSYCRFVQSIIDLFLSSINFKVKKFSDFPIPFLITYQINFMVINFLLFLAYVFFFFFFFPKTLNITFPWFVLTLPLTLQFLEILLKQHPCIPLDLCWTSVIVGN